MGSCTQIIVLAEEQRADKGAPLAHEPERQRAFDEREAEDGWRGAREADEGVAQRSRRVTGLDLM